MNSEPIANICGVTKILKMSKVPALNEISTSIFPGKITGLVGPDGAGKTTFIRLLTGLMRPDKGTISIAGYNTLTSANKIYPIIGYMPQKFGLYENLSVKENIELYAKLRNIPSAEQKKVFKQLLSFTGLELFQKYLVYNLSGGMKQKLGLACAILGDPKLLLLDEPSVGVDPISRLELWQMIKQLLEKNISVVWSTSYLDEAEKCDNVILLNRGNKVYDGCPIKILTKIKDRTFQLDGITANERQNALTHILQDKNIIDAKIKGKYIHIVLNNPDPKFSFLSLFKSDNVSCTSVPPSFEDAFISILGGIKMRTSPLETIIKEKPKQEKPIIAANNLTKKFGNLVAVHDINFSIQRGEIFGLIGPNGAGKSTTFKMLCGLLPPTKGNSLIMGLDLNKAGSKARNRIGYMAQKFSLYNNLNALQNLKFFSGLYGLSGKTQKEKIDMMVHIFNLKDYLNKNSGDLPLGFKQRLALACTLVHEPDILFLDEPTAGVDPLTRREFWMHINTIVKKGITVMVTTHYMEEAEYCDRIGFIYYGKNIATGTPSQLKKMIINEKLIAPTLEDVFIELTKKHDVITQNMSEVKL